MIRVKWRQLHRAGERISAQDGRWRFDRRVDPLVSAFFVADIFSIRIATIAFTLVGRCRLKSRLSIQRGRLIASCKQTQKLSVGQVRL